MKEIKCLSDLLILYDIIDKSGLYDSINYNDGILEIQLTKDISEISDRLEAEKIDYDRSSNKSFEVIIDKNYVFFFPDKKTFYDRINNTDLILNNKSLFIWDCDKSFLLYENFNIENAIANRTQSGDFIANVVQYRDFLKLFLDEKSQLIELEKAHPRNELFIVSKGNEKLLVKLNYNRTEDELYSKKFEYVNLEQFSVRIQNEAWLSCFKNTVCAFFDQQAEHKRTFQWLYENFFYLFANTEKSYFLYISQFSFDKISKQFKKDREHYFNSLNEYQNKISGQLISIPLTIGAALLSSNFETNNGLANSSVTILISAYVIFVMGTISFILVDLNKLKNDICGENDALKSMYNDIYENFEKDFKFIIKKAKFLMLFGIFLLLLFGLVLAVVWFAPLSTPSKEVFFTQRLFSSN